ncbi:hypothetical protein B0H14DRAFT_2620722 [Mycena olivaceomarginata]|nr:hypothetical protein B0H14DRAFT_2620722 [Mycena olivaceomarginata]
MLHQLWKLLAAPLKQVPSLAVRPIIVIDGLDEFEDRSVQVMLLKLLIDGLRNGGLPAWVLIASRSEPHLREVLQAVPKKTILRRVLHATVQTSENLDPKEIDVALQLWTGNLRLVLWGLHSVVCVSLVHTFGFRYGITFLHASLRDFLLDLICSSELMIVFLSSLSPNSPVFNEITEHLVHFIVRIEPITDLVPVLQNPNILQASFSLDLESISEIVDWLQDIYEFGVLLCISRIRKILLNNQFFQLNRTWLLMISWCKHSHMLHELESLDVVQLCAGPLRSDTEYHLACHKDFLSPGSVKWISFPSPAKQAIEFWERQMVAVETCRKSLLQQH